MQAPHAAPSSTDVATEVNRLLVGLGILTMALFPFALPGLLLALLLVLPTVPLALAAVAVWLLARILALSLRLARSLVGRRPVPRPAAESPGSDPVVGTG